VILFAFALIILVVALLGAPLFSIILAIALLGFYYLDINLSVIAIEIYRISDMPLLLALPLFTFSGYLLGESQTSKRLLKLTQAIIGWMPNGLAIVAFIACAFFTAFTGASGVTIVALGGLLYPSLIKAGYHEKFSIALVTTSGSLGILFPPSLPLILYGIIAQQLQLGKNVTIDALFLAGIFPGILMIISLSIWSYWTNRKCNIPLIPFSYKRAIIASKEAIWEIPLPIFLLYGIYSGFLAISELAAVTAMYVIVVEVFIYKEIEILQLFAIMRKSMVMVGGILIIISVSLASTNFLIDAEVPMMMFQFIKAHVSDKIVFLMFLNILLLLIGAVLDIFSALVIMVPLILPVAVSYGIDPVHLGIIFIANMQIGYFTPPVGMDLFIASYRFKKPITELYSATVPFMIILFAVVLIITYWPALSLVLL